MSRDYILLFLTFCIFNYQTENSNLKFVIFSFDLYTSSFSYLKTVRVASKVMNEENNNSRTIYFNKKEVNLEDAYIVNFLYHLEKNIVMQNQMV